MLGAPSLELAKDLAASGIRRLVFTSSRLPDEWEAAERVLLDAGVEIVPTWVDNTQPVV